MRSNFIFLLAIICCLVKGTPAQGHVELKFSLDTKNELTSGAFSPDGKLVAVTSGRSTTVLLWDTGTGKLKARLSGADPNYLVGDTDVGGIEGPSHVSFSPDGNSLLVVARGAHEVRMWNVETGKQYITLANLRTMSNAVISPDGQLLALAAGLQGLQVIDITTRKLVNTRWQIKDVIGVWSVDFSKDGSTLLTSIDARNGKSGFYLLDVRTGGLKAVIKVTKDNTLKGRLSPDSQTFVTVDDSSVAKFWDMTDGQLKKTINGIKGQIYSLAISPDNRTLVIIGKDKSVKFYNSESGEVRLELAGIESIPSASVFSRDGRIFLTEDKGGIKIWDSITGALKQTLDRARFPLAFNRDGSMLLTGSKGKAALLWQVSAN